MLRIESGNFGFVNGFAVKLLSMFHLLHRCRSHSQGQSDHLLLTNTFFVIILKKNMEVRRYEKIVFRSIGGNVSLRLRGRSQGIRIL